MVFLFFISALAETNRPPFDLPEAESELVAGYQVEYSSTPFLLFMAGEYIAIFLDVRLDHLVVFWRLDISFALHCRWASLDGWQNGHLLFPHRDGEGSCAALPL